MIVRVNKYFKALFSKNNRNTKRGIWIILYAFNGLSTPIFNLILSAVIVKKISLGFWGEFVSLSLIVTLSAFIIGWGNKDFLLREFSRVPAQIASNWQTNIFQRAILCLLAACSFFLFINHSNYRICLLIFWIISTFLYKSLDVLILFKRLFSFSLLAETIGYAIVIGIVAIYDSKELTVDLLILILAIITFLKFLIGLWYLRKDIFPIVFKWGKFSLKTNTLFLSIPYFLPTLAGLLQSKVDIYCVAYFLSPSEVGGYQIFMNLLTVPHSLATFIVLPFIKNIYRMPVKSVKKIIKFLTLIGFVFSLPALIIIYFIMENYYKLHFSLSMYTYGFIMLLPFFMYTVKMNLLFKYDKQYVIVWITTLTGGISLLASIVLIPSLNIEGGIIAKTITQWITFLLFYMYTNRYLKSHG